MEAEWASLAFLKIIIESIRKVPRHWPFLEFPSWFQRIRNLSMNLEKDAEEFFETSLLGRCSVSTTRSFELHPHQKTNFHCFLILYGVYMREIKSPFQSISSTICKCNHGKKLGEKKQAPRRRPHAAVPKSRFKPP